MEITIKEIKQLKSGSNKKGEWVLIGITGEDEKKYATFDKKFLELPPGTKIEVDEATIDTKGQATIKKWHTIETAIGRPQVNKEPVSKSLDQWNIERRSIEAQTAYNGIIELSKAYLQISVPEIKDEKVLRLRDLALEWAEVRLRGTMPPKKS